MENDLYQLLLARLADQGIEPADLPLFLRDLTTHLNLAPDADAPTLNSRLKLLGWHQAQLDYQSIQLALAWMDAEADSAAACKPM